MPSHSIKTTRTIYNPTLKNFVFDSSEEKAMPNIKRWIDRRNSAIYWYILRIDNPSELLVLQWAIELYTHRALSITEAYIDGIDHCFDLRKSERDHWSDKYILSIPKELQIPIVGSGTRRIFFKVDVNCREGLMYEYGISGRFIADGFEPVDIRVKKFIYSCKAGEFRQIFDNNPDEASTYAEKRLSNRYAPSSIRIFTNSFRMIYDLNSYCQSNYIEREELLSKLCLLRSNFENIPEIASKRIIPLLDSGIKILSALDTANMNDFKTRYLRLCSDLVELLHLEVVSSNESYEGISKEKEKQERLRKKQDEEARLRKSEEERLRRQREEEKELKRKEIEEQEKLKRQREEGVKKLEEIKRKAQEEAERKRKEKEVLERKQLEEQQRKRIEAKKRSSRKRILVFSLILGILIIGTAVSYIGLNGDSDDDSLEIPPVSFTPSENTEEDTPTASPAQTSSSQNSDTYTNSIGMEFVLIPAGEFMMGSPSGEEDRSSNEGPVHKVTIEEPFYMGKFEVTQEQWREVMGSDPSYFEGDDLPVEQVLWSDVQEFIEELNEMEDTKKYRLPSEAEWEYACRAGKTTRYYFGDDESKLGDYAWYGENWSSGSTHPVGQKKSNPWGLYDMHGNVDEWCQDRWHEDYDGAPSDGSAWKDGSSSNRVIRSVSWNFDAGVCRSASRSYFYPDIRSNCIGFRVLRDI